MKMHHLFFNSTGKIVFVQEQGHANFIIGRTFFYRNVGTQNSKPKLKNAGMQDAKALQERAKISELHASSGNMQFCLSMNETKKIMKLPQRCKTRQQF